MQTRNRAWSGNPGRRAETRSRILSPLLVLAVTAACTPPSEAPLADQAHSAVLDLLEDRVSARFDDGEAYQDATAGLFCSGKVSARDEAGAYSRYRRYYFLKDHGAAIEGGYASPLLANLMRQCDDLAYGRAMELFHGD